MCGGVVACGWGGGRRAGGAAGGQLEAGAGAWVGEGWRGVAQSYNAVVKPP